ncbi:hypothetical protein [Vibrio natriegens]|jgi:hypothetical protein|uniref:Uncharacterized protein n=1 Tax=Vibrio natriegens NBRC 15636 = ATCC 14048 = DSM 759 TaxID=1219067 RepID=A0AAN0Y2H7_VIBNA|nr:hypothetical protein [Vibrio natriegens]ALR15499.1 hypothetical protein PN96_05700 [Vibrio natriegens NBRC 15636 = ATCC 14048 = DSM 759]ANQ12641.1 hypothetical protein BA890_07645 [Vibrio natriegens NBRC 15636 = ATCC 14048 = DSM 759]ANQ26383.1 hypothetical protein BA894_07955 [Vibrio natriegens]EPM42230.1 hypothetical protein M272_03170 [Vibrio natriegens NBRC 15636 = ATCC 14048 = DSM 759]MCY9878242.1 hypothetical protein [Vibrio natriegens]
MSHLKSINKIPFKELLICGSRVYETQKIIEYKDIEPIVIANGIKPRIWLTVLVENGDSFALVDDSRAKHESVICNVTTSNVEIYVDDHFILKGTRSRTERFHIHHLDLRSLGFSVYGSDESGLYANGVSLNSISARGGRCLIKLG